jgi:hypothetical protein
MEFGQQHSLKKLSCDHRVNNTPPATLHVVLQLGISRVLVAGPWGGVCCEPSVT